MANGMQSAAMQVSRDTSMIEEGMNQAFNMLREVYNMDADTRYVLFGREGVTHLLMERSPEYIMDILNRKQEILDGQVSVGMLLFCDEDDTEAIVTYVYPDTRNMEFDAIISHGKGRGHVLSHMNMRDYPYQKTGGSVDVYKIKELEKYTWE